MLVRVISIFNRNCIENIFNFQIILTSKLKIKANNQLEETIWKTQTYKTTLIRDIIF